MKILVLQHFFIYYTSHSRRNFIQFQISRTKRRINFLHSSSFRSLRFYFRSSFLSFSLSSLLFLALCLYLSLSICLFVPIYIYIYIYTYVYRLLFLSLSAVLLHEQNKSKFVPYLTCTMFAKHPKKNILYRSIESSARRTILENSFLQSFAKKNGGCLAYAFPGSRDFIINRNWKCGDIESILTRLSVE